MQRKIAILAPEFPPVKGGVSDYTKKLHQEFSHQNIPHIIITNKNSKRQKSDSVINIDIPAQYSTIKNILSVHNITDILIEYTPKSFNPSNLGINLWLVFLLFRLKNSVRIHTYAHETNFPIELSKAGLILGPIHTAQFYFISLLSNTITFSTKRFEKRWQRLVPTKKHVMSTLPIGSNIESKDNDLNDIKRSEQIIFFGSKHPTCLKDTALNTLVHIAKTFSHINFIILGLNKSDLPTTKYSSRFSFPGHIDELEISNYYKDSILSILPLMDGCSTRRGTLMCSLAHGVPVLTNFGVSTDEKINWSKFCYITEIKDYEKTAIKVLEDRQSLLTKQKSSYKYYNQHYSWPVITANLLKIIMKSS